MMIADKKIISSFGKTTVLFVQVTDEFTLVCDGYRILKMTSKYMSYEIKAFLAGKFLKEMKPGVMLKVRGGKIEPGTDLTQHIIDGASTWVYTGLIYKASTSAKSYREMYIFESEGEYKYISRGYIDGMDIHLEEVKVGGLEGEDGMLMFKENMKYGSDVEYYVLPVRWNSVQSPYLKE